MAQWVKNLPAMQETQETRVQFLGREKSPGREMATHFGILALEILWTKDPCGLQSKGLQRDGHD